jgi:hypothetical protein
MTAALRLSPRERAKLYLAIADAMDVPEPAFINCQRHRARAEFAESITERDPAETFAALAVADDICLWTEGHDYHVAASEVAAAYSIDKGYARHALKLAGWVSVGGGRWESEPGATTAWHPEPCDMLAELFE